MKIINNENGFASLAAIFMMSIIALTIMSMTNIAARQSEIFYIDRQELKLQNAAESAFYEVTAQLENNFEYYGTLGSGDVKAINFNINDVPVEVLLRKHDKTVENFPKDKINTKYSIIAIRSLATAQNNKYKGYNVYKRVYGYMKRVEIVDGNSDEVIEVDQNYEFTEYLE